MRIRKGNYPGHRLCLQCLTQSGPLIQVFFSPRAGVEKEGYGTAIKTSLTFLRLHFSQWSGSHALHAWLRTATKEPDWLIGMSLPLLENKIKNRECVPLLNIMQVGGKVSHVLAGSSRKKCNIRVARTGMRSGGRGMAPSDPMFQDSHPTLGKNTL